MLAALDDEGKQIPELQESLLCLWAERAEEKGYDVNGSVIETPRGLVRLVKHEPASVAGYTPEASWNTESV